jgi:type III pantothenate kinase
MLLTIDIGNTLTKYGVYEDDVLIYRLTVPTVQTHDPAELYNHELDQNYSAVIISSVVPELKNAYQEFSNKYFNVESIFVDNSLDLGLKIRYVPAETLGVDRLIAAFAAVEKYGKPCIICDFGTATTIDTVNSGGEYLGGIITPGMDTMRESLFTKTSILPLIKLRKPENIIGNSTVTSIQSGIYYGYIALVEGLIEKITGELGETPNIVATGGFAEIIAEGCKLIQTVDETLMLDGLRMVYEARFR